ncbi:MAG: amylo-alpha-1,6-glucosidase, partial [Planctomycetota bacterium]
LSNDPASATISIERRDDIGPTVVRDAYYALEAARHQPELESLVSPGVFALDVAPEEGEATLTIAIALTPEMPDLTLFDADPRAEHLEHVVDGMCAKRDDLRALAPLVSASDDFLVQRRVGETTLMTVIAGYPWFADWGRDTMISLPGLMLTTHRFEDARSCLETFARHVSRGMIPNRFDDYGGDPHYNTVDASLWFLHAVHAFQQATEDRDGFGGPGSSGTIRDACHQIIAHYQSGTRFGIGMDLDDALIFAGDDTTQLTWMDAKREQTVFTPRHGKAVEINALWCHGLRCVAALIEKDERDRADAYRVLADRVQESFRSQFTDAATGGLHDCLRGDGARGFVPTGEVRPNQIFAASLEFGPLDDETRRGVVGVVRERLRTPEGLRTLAPGSAAYQARFEGDMMRRDRAYHNGTVWPWLIGHYAEAVLRAESFSIEARAEAQDAIATLIASMSAQAGPGCVGQIAEVYDADEPRRQEGCTAQAWSVAEVLRIAALLSE